MYFRTRNALLDSDRPIVHPPSVRCSEDVDQDDRTANPARDNRPLRVDDFDRFIFVVGAPRCGTTTMFQLLKSNPRVASPFVKEPHFFVQHDLRTLSEADLRSRVEREYLRRFYHREPTRRIGVDASVTYLYAPEQLEPILKLWPESRFVVALRDPVAMLPSLHKRLIYNGDETLADFGDAWAAVTERRAGRQVPRYCADPRWLLYDEPCRYSTYLERLYSTVGRERCHVVLFDDLVSAPTLQYLRLMQVAGLNATARIDISAQRPSYGVRFRWLQRLLKRPPHILRELVGGEKFARRFRDLDTLNERRVSNGILSLRKRLLDWNQISCAPEPPPEWVLDDICRRFKSEVDDLGILLGRDLSHWLGSDTVRQP